MAILKKCFKKYNENCSLEFLYLLCDVEINTSHKNSKRKGKKGMKNIEELLSQF